MGHRRVSTLAEASSHRERVVYLWGDDVALAEDLVEGFKAAYRRSWELGPDNVSTVSTADELLREMNTRPVGRFGVRFIVARDAHKLLAGKRTESILERWDFERANPRLFCVLVGQEPPDLAARWLVERDVLARFRGPTITQVGKWLAARSMGQWRYSTLWKTGFFDPAWGPRYMEHVGWSFAAALQGLKAMAVYEPSGWRLEALLELVPPVVHSGFVDALTLSVGRRGAAIRMAGGVTADEIPVVLGSLRYRLRLFGLARSFGAEIFPDREVAERLGLEPWQWDRYKAAYPSYTEEKIRRRLAAISGAEALFRQGVTTGVLEQVAVVW